METFGARIVWLSLGIILCYLLLHLLLSTGQKEENQLRRLIDSRIERIRELRRKIIVKKRHRC